MRILFSNIVTTEQDSVKLYRDAIVEIDEEGHVQSIGKYAGEKIDLELKGCSLLPKFLNGHIHVLDLKLRGKFETVYIDDLVGAPYGIKYQYLRKADIEELKESVKYALDVAHRAGTGTLYIVVEYGLRHYKLVQELCREYELDCVLFLEPSCFHVAPEREPFLVEIVQECIEAVKLGHNVELISPLNYRIDELREVEHHVHSEGRLIMTHVSETEDTFQEGDPELAIDVLRADILVHCVFTPLEMIEKLNGKIVVVNLRSNLKLVKRVPSWLNKLQDVGVRLCLGTDNVGLNDPDMWQELEVARVVLGRDLFSKLVRKVFEDASNLSPRCRVDVGCKLEGQIMPIGDLVDSVQDLVEKVLLERKKPIGVITCGKVRLFT